MSPPGQSTAMIAVASARGASIAADIRVARRERPSWVPSVRQDPNQAVPDGLACQRCGGREAVFAPHDPWETGGCS
jgi:hypothetical protein